NLTSNAGPAPDGEILLRRAPFDARYAMPTSGRYYQISRIENDGALAARIASRSLYDVTLNLDPRLVRELIEGPANDGGVGYADLAKGPDNGPVRLGARILRLRGVEEDYLFVVAIAPDETLRRARNIVAAGCAAFVAFCGLLVVAVTLLQIRV